MITESRLALIISGIAVVITAWQAIEARRANSLNSEDLQIEVRQASSDYFDCGQDLSRLAVLWSVQVSNNSLQPALIRSVGANENLPTEHDLPSVTRFSATLLSDESSKRLPFTILPKSYASFELVQAITTTPEEKVKLEQKCTSVSTFQWDGNGGLQPVIGVSVFDITQSKTLSVLVEVVTSTGSSFIGSGSSFDLRPFF